MEGGPPSFPQGSSCPVVLRILPSPPTFRVRGSYPLWPWLSIHPSAKSSGPSGSPLPRTGEQKTDYPLPSVLRCGLGSSAFARHYLRNHCCFLFLRVLRCFNSPRLAPSWLCVHHAVPGHLPRVGSPIRTSTGLRLFAPHRGFSQLVTSFFASWCLGIHPTPFIA